MYKLIFTLIIAFSITAIAQNDDFSKVCQQYIRDRCDNVKSPAVDALLLRCQADYQKNQCEEFKKQSGMGLSGIDLEKSNNRIIGCTLKDICLPTVNIGIQNCAKAAFVDVPISILTKPIQAFEFILDSFQKDKACFEDISGKAEILEKFNSLVNEKQFQFDDVFFTGDFLANIPCRELNELIRIKKKKYFEYIGPLVAQGKKNNPFEQELDFHEQVRKGFNNLSQKINCLRPEVQAEFYCEFAAYAAIGKLSLNLIKNAQFKSLIEKSESFNANIGVKYKSIPMNSKYKGEEIGVLVNNVKMNPKYLNAEQLRRFEVEVVGGRLIYKNSKQPVDSYGQNTLYVMDEFGKIYAGLPRNGGKFHHSSFFAGGDVAAAGEIRIKNGVIQKIDRNSGHYKPSPSEFNQVLLELKNRGVNLLPRQIDFAVRAL